MGGKYTDLEILIFLTVCIYKLIHENNVSKHAMFKIQPTISKCFVLNKTGYCSFLNSLVKSKLEMFAFFFFFFFKIKDISLLVSYTYLGYKLRLFSFSCGK